MSQREIPAVGIDLGTTYSAVAVLDDKDCPQTLLNAESERTTPSVLLFDGQNVVVGKLAESSKNTHFEGIVEYTKRDLGKRSYHKHIEGVEYPPEALLAFILNKLKKDSVAQIGDFTKAVITVPAYFDEVRRKATQDAGYLAGIEVLDIINASDFVSSQPKKKSVEITSESCYSGMICHNAKKWWEETKENGNLDIKHLIIMSSTYKAK